MQRPPSSLILSQNDYRKLSSLVSSIQTETSDLLEEELSRASIVPDADLPKDVVAMHSTVRFLDLDSGKESTVTLVFPHEANVDENKISILVPIGAALIGLGVGQEIQWPMPNGQKRRLKIVAVG